MIIPLLTGPSLSSSSEEDRSYLKGNFHLLILFCTASEYQCLHSEAVPVSPLSLRLLLSSCGLY